jgi:SOS-response transcriptional repressor LexA
MAKNQAEIVKIREIVKRIDLILKEKGTNRPEICKKLGINTSSFNDWEGGSTPSLYTMIRIADDLAVSLDYLVYSKYSQGEKINPKSLILAQKIEELTESQKGKVEGIVDEFRNIPKPDSFYVSEPTPVYNTSVDMTDIVALPYYGRIAAGDPLDVSAIPDEFIHFPRRGLRGSAKDHFALTVAGYSMTEAGIVDGATIVIKKTEEPAYGEIMLVRYENSITLKRVIKQDGKVYLAWENGTGKRIEVNSSEYRAEGILVWAMKQFTGAEY